MNPKNFSYAVALVILILIVFFVYDYLNTDTETPLQIKIDATNEFVKNTDNQKNVCQLINNSTFRSLKKYNAGMGPDGPVDDNYEIIFLNGKFDWSAGEVGGGNGTYLCNNNEIIGKIGETYTVNGTYNNETKVLIWNKIEYKK